MWPQRPPRIKGFPYLGFQRYFVTITANFRTRWFANEARAGDLAVQIAPFLATRQFEVLAYCLMPDHLHLLLEDASEDADLREAIRAWKQRTGYDWKRSTGAQLWQSGFHDHVLRAHDDTRAVIGYILMNPVRAGLVTTPGQYPWLGSFRYSLADLQEHAGGWTPDWK
jgi:putative transposase